MRSEGMETYSRIGLIRSYGNLQSYWTNTKLSKLTVVLDYYEAMETYSRIGLLQSYGNLQSYWTITGTYVPTWESSSHGSTGRRAELSHVLSGCFIFSTRFECIFTSFPLVSSVFSPPFHSFREYSHIFSTRFECSLKRAPRPQPSPLKMVFIFFHSTYRGGTCLFNGWRMEKIMWSWTCRVKFWK